MVLGLCYCTKYYTIIHSNWIFVQNPKLAQTIGAQTILKNRNRHWIMFPTFLHIRFSTIKRFGNNAHGLAESRAFHYFVKSVYTNQQYVCVCFANKSTYYTKCFAT